MGKIKDSVNFVGMILTSRAYLTTFLLVTVITFFIMSYLTLKTVANQSLKILIMMSGVNYVFFDFLLALIVSVLSGLFVILFVKKFNMVRKTSSIGIFGALGVTLGLFAAGCPTCGAFLFSLIGFPLALTYIPFEGIGLKLISVLFLVLANYFLIQGMLSCKIKFKIIDDKWKNLS